MNCCQVMLLQNGDEIKVEFDCETHCREGLCKHQGDWSYYGGGTCSKAHLGDSVGCFCTDKAVQAEALRTVVGKIQEKIAELEETRPPAQTPEHSVKLVRRDCINWSNGDHCAKTKCNYCRERCEDYRPLSRMKKPVHGADDIRKAAEEAVVAKRTPYGVVKNTEKTNTLKAILHYAADVIERAVNERETSRKLGHQSRVNKCDRILFGYDENGELAAKEGAEE